MSGYSGKGLVEGRHSSATVGVVLCRNMRLVMGAGFFMFIKILNKISFKIEVSIMTRNPTYLILHIPAMPVPQ